MKNIFGYHKAHYRDLEKNEIRLYMLFELAPVKVGNGEKYFLLGLLYLSISHDD